MGKQVESGPVRIEQCLARARTEIEACVTLEDALHRVLTLSVECLSADHGNIALCGLERGHLELHPRQDPQEGLKESRRLDIESGRGIAGHVAQTGQPYRWNGDPDDPYFSPSRSGRTVYPILAAPILAHGSVIGVICIEQPEQGLFTAEDEHLLSRLAEQAALVIERCLVLDALLQLGQSAVGVPLAEVLQRIAQQASELLDKSTCAIELWDGQGGTRSVETSPQVGDGAGTDTLLRFSAPLVSLRGDTLGTIRIYNPDVLTLWQQSLCSAFIKHASIAVENARLLDQNQRHVRIMETLHTMTEKVTQLLRGQGDDAVLHLIAQYASQVLGTDVLIVYPYQESQCRLETPPICLGDIRYPEYLKHRVYPDALPARILGAPDRYHYWPQAAQSQLLAGETENPDPKEPPRDRFVVREGIASTAAVGLVVGNKPVGVAFFSFRRPQAFDREQRWVIEAFANYTALTLDTLASHRQIRASTSRQEAERWNRELHDSVLQVLTGGVLAKAGVIKHQLRRQDYDNAAANLDRLERAAQHVYNEVQDIRTELTERTLAQEGLVSALQNHIDFRREQAPVGPAEDRALRESPQIEFTHGGLGVLSPETEHNLYRIAQEALNNALKSAHADQIRVSLQAKGDETVLLVEDNGRGFDVAAALPQSFGLIGMRTRASAVGGHLEIESRPGEGTRVLAVVPSRRKEADPYGPER